MTRFNKNSEDASGCLVIIVLLIIAAPVIGIILLTRDNQEDRIWGRIILGVYLSLMFIYALFG